MFTIHSQQLSKLIVYYSTYITLKSPILPPHFASDAIGNYIDKVVKFHQSIISDAPNNQ